MGWVEEENTSDSITLIGGLQDNNLGDGEDDEILDDEHMSVFAVVLSNVLLFILIFGLSATVDFQSLKRQITNKFAIGCGVSLQFLIMPVLGFVSVMTFRNQGLTTAMGVTLLIVTSSPGGAYSNWWCSTFNADLALSVAMTTVSSILSAGLLPLNLVLYTYLAYGVAEDAEVVESVDFAALFISLGVVLVAIATGLYAGVRWDYPRFHETANRLGSVAGIILIVLTLYLSSGGDTETAWYNMPWSMYVAVCIPVLIGIGLANAVSQSVKLSGPECVAISIECCYQNVGIATSAAITMFTNKEERAEALAVPLLYAIVEFTVIGAYCLVAWKRGWTKAPPNENFCVVLTKTYEVSEQQPKDMDENNSVEIETSFDGYEVQHRRNTTDTGADTGAETTMSSAGAVETFKDDSVTSSERQQIAPGGLLSRMWSRMGSRSTGNKSPTESVVVVENTIDPLTSTTTGEQREEEGHEVVDRLRSNSNDCTASIHTTSPASH